MSTSTKIRFHNARILSMQKDTSVVSGEVWVENERIIFTGVPEAGKAEEISWDREIDCRGNLLMPGFKNAHTHSAMTLMRSYADDMPLDKWLTTQIFPYEAKMQDEDVYWLTKIALLEYLSGGITGIMEMYMAPHMVAKACREYGMRLVQVGGVNDFSGSSRQVEECFNELNGVSPLTSFCLGFHAEYTCSPELLGEMASLARKYQAPVFTHVAETRKETDDCIARYGMTPVAYLAQRGIFDYGGAGYHMVYTNEEDRRIMKEKGICVVTNPGSNTKLASGIAPISDYLRDDIMVGIGTDGPASNNCLDMFREMFLTTGLGKLREMDASAVPAEEVMKMAVSNGAHIMQCPDADMLAAGKLADMIMIDLQQPNMQPLNNISNNLVYSGTKMNVIMTMIHGVIRYERDENGIYRFHVEDDPRDIYRQAEKIKERIYG